MLPSTMPLAVSAEGFPPWGKGIGGAAKPPERLRS